MQIHFSPDGEIWSAYLLPVVAGTTRMALWSTSEDRATGEVSAHLVACCLLPGDRDWWQSVRLLRPTGLLPGEHCTIDRLPPPDTNNSTL